MLHQCRFHTAIVIATIVCGCSRPDKQGLKVPVADKIPIIVLDDAHNHASSQEASDYSIPASESLVVESGSYTIRVPEKLKVSGPNALHLIHGAEGYYRVPWNGSGRAQVNASTLEVIKGPAKFSGFKSGEKYMVGVGADSISDADKKLRFSVMWVGTINVR